MPVRSENSRICAVVVMRDSSVSRSEGRRASLAKSSACFSRMSTGPAGRSSVTNRRRRGSRLSQVAAGGLLGHDCAAVHHGRAMTKRSAPLRRLPMPIRARVGRQDVAEACTSWVKGTNNSTCAFVHPWVSSPSRRSSSSTTRSIERMPPALCRLTAVRRSSRRTRSQDRDGATTCGTCRAPTG
jgi:hypothetical protein